MSRCKIKPTEISSFEYRKIDFSDSEAMADIIKFCQRHGQIVKMEKNSTYPKGALMSLRFSTNGFNQIYANYGTAAENGDYVVETGDNDIIFLNERTFNAKYEKLKSFDGFINLMLITPISNYCKSLKAIIGDKLLATNECKDGYQEQFWAIEFKMDDATTNFIKNRLLAEITCSHNTMPDGKFAIIKHTLKQAGTDNTFSIGLGDYIIFKMDPKDKHLIIQETGSPALSKTKWVILSQEKIIY